MQDGSELNSEPADSAADKADLVYGLQDSLKKVDAMVASVASPDTADPGRTMRLSANRNMTGFCGPWMSSRKICGALAARGNPTADAMFSTALYAQWEKSLRQIDDSMQVIQRGEGAAGHFYASDEQYTTILEPGAGTCGNAIAEMRADMVKAGPGLRDETGYQKITKMLASTDAMLAALNRGEGQAGELLTSPQLYESLLGSLRSIDELVKDFRANPTKYLRAKVF